MDVQTILQRARNGNAPSDWHVFSGMIHPDNSIEGTESDPSPLLVITPEYAIEYVNFALPLVIIPFEQVRTVCLKILQKEFAGNFVVARTYLRLSYQDGSPGYWSPQPDFAAERGAILQCFIETHLKYRLFQQEK